MRAALVILLLAMPAGSAAGQSAGPFADQLAATVQLDDRVRPAVFPDSTTALTETKESHIRRHVAGAAAAGTVFALLFVGGTALSYSDNTVEALPFVLKGVAVGAGTGALLGLVVGLITPPNPCGCP